MGGKAKPNVVSLSARAGEVRPISNRLGRITAWSAETGLMVEHEGATDPCAAISVVALTAEAIDALIASRQPVLLAFDGGDPQRPIVVGVVQPTPSAQAAATAVSKGDGTPVTALIDGEEVILEGTERVELKCGEASLLLTSDGKVLIRGTYVSSHSSGSNRIRGGSVEVN